MKNESCNKAEEKPGQQTRKRKMLQRTKIKILKTRARRKILPKEEEEKRRGVGKTSSYGMKKEDEEKKKMVGRGGTAAG